MSTPTCTDHMDRILDLFDGPVDIQTRGTGDLHSPFTVIVSQGCTDVHFTFGSDFVWRMTDVINFGNHNFVTGPGCDASGFVIRDMDIAATLDGMFQ